MLAGLSGTTYLSSLSNAPTKTGPPQTPNPFQYCPITYPLAPPHDVVCASYVLREVDLSSSRDSIIRSLWAHTSGVLVIVEPGTHHANDTM